MPGRLMGSGCIDPRILDLGINWRWAVSFTDRPLYPRGKSSRYSLNRRLDGDQNRSGQNGEEKILSLPALGLRPLGRPARSQSLYRLRYPGSAGLERSGGGLIEVQFSAFAWRDWGRPKSAQSMSRPELEPRTFRMPVNNVTATSCHLVCVDVKFGLSPYEKKDWGCWEEYLGIIGKRRWENEAKMK
jgi:hypothetical protein